MTSRRWSRRWHDGVHAARPIRTLIVARSRPLLADVVREQLRAAILSGEFPVGSKLANEDRLCERFGVSRITIRDAVRGLIDDGFVVRRHGSGTYVTRRPALHGSLEVNFSYTAYLESSGAKAGRRILAIRTMPGDAETSEALDLAVGDPVVENRRIRTADRKPAIYSIDYLPGHLVDPAGQRTGLHGSLYRLLTTLGHPVSHADARLIPVTADDELARILDVRTGTPLQFLRQLDYDTSDAPVMLSLEWHVPARIELRVYRRGPGVVL
jgi:DNA-binding GntR family transcriptional regulator